MRGPPRQSSGLREYNTVTVSSQPSRRDTRGINTSASLSFHFLISCNAFFLQNPAEVRGQGRLVGAIHGGQLLEAQRKGKGRAQRHEQYSQHCSAILAKCKRGQSRRAVHLPECGDRRGRDQDGRPDDHRAHPVFLNSLCFRTVLEF